MTDDVASQSRPRKSPSGFLVNCLLTLFVVVVVIGVVGYSFYGKAVEDRARVDSLVDRNHLKQTALTILNRHAAYGVLPRPAMTDKPGHVPYSWRVPAIRYLGMPQLEQLEQAYDYQSTWNAATNIATCRVSVPQFALESAKNKDEYCTNVFMPTGPGTVGERGISLDDITDDHATTILLICALESDVPWHEPRDIHISEFTRDRGNPDRILFRGKPFVGTYVATVDASAHWLPADLKYDTLMAMLTIAGGEEVNLTDLKR
jgi:hypothetical protein